MADAGITPELMPRLPAALGRSQDSEQDGQRRDFWPSKIGRGPSGGAGSLFAARLTIRPAWPKKF